MSDVPSAPTTSAPTAAQPARPPGRLKSLVFTLIVLCLMGGLVEGAARLAAIGASEEAQQVRDIEANYRTTPESMFVLDPLLLWRPKPEFTGDFRYLVNLSPMQATEATYHVRLNAHGFRGPDLVTPKKGLRVFCLGDSVTFGLNAPDDFTYPAVLQARFDAVAPGAMEVVNAGVPSYSSDHGVLWLEHVILPLAPDFVVLGYGHNDLWMQPRDIRIFLEAHGQDDWVARTRRLLNHSAAYRAYKRAVLAARERVTDAEDDAPRAPTTRTYDNYLKMLRLCRDHNVPAAILLLYNQRPEIQTQLRMAAQEFSVPVIDLASLFNALGPQTLMSEQRHPNTRGYAVIGIALANELAARLGLPAPPPVTAQAAPGDAASGGASADLSRAGGAL